MITVNDLVIDGVSTSSFPFPIIVKEPYTYEMSDSKTQLLEHSGINGAVIQTNKRRPLIRKEYTLQLIEPEEQELQQLLTLLTREGFWLEHAQAKQTRLWCYKVENVLVTKETATLYNCRAVFVCHPTKYFKELDTQTLTGNGVLRVQGSSLAFPKITVVGQSASETSFTVGNQVIRLEKLSESLVMHNNPDNPSFKTASGKLIKWSGDFITIDASKGPTIGVVFGPGITSLKFETVWGWA